MRDVTGNQRKIFDAIVTLTAERGFAPSIREIGAAVGLTSSSTIHYHLDALKRRGVIDNCKGSPRTLRVLRPLE
jgi:repressor LexA